jgi:hypothetical protein
MIIFLELFSVHSHIHIKDSGIKNGMCMFFRNHSLFDRVHTTNTGTVGMTGAVGRPGAYTLYPGYFFGLFTIKRPHQMTGKRAGSTQNTFKLHAGDNVWRIAVTIGLETGWIE